MTFGCHIIAIEILVLWTISWGSTKKYQAVKKNVLCYQSEAKNKCILCEKDSPDSNREDKMA